MKGIIVELNKKEAVILSDDGLFQKIKNPGYEIGQTVNYNPKGRAASKFAAGVTGLVAAFALCTLGVYAYMTPTDYVSLDVNPSIEYSVNTFDRILDVEAVNDDGEEILSDLDLNHKSIRKGIEATLDRLIEGKYISADTDGKVIIATSNDKPHKAERLAAELELAVQAYLDNKENITADVEAEAVLPERVQAAKEKGVTPGKLNLVEKLQQSTGRVMTQEEWEQWLAMPVKDINKAIKENRQLEKDKTEKKDKDKSQQGQDAAESELESPGKSSVEKVQPVSNGQNKKEDVRELNDDSDEDKDKDKDKDTDEDESKIKDKDDVNNEEPDSDEAVKENPGLGDEKKNEKASDKEKKTDDDSDEDIKADKDTGEDKKADKDTAEDKKTDKNDRSEADGDNPGNGEKKDKTKK